MTRSRGMTSSERFRFSLDLGNHESSSAIRLLALCCLGHCDLGPRGFFPEVMIPTRLYTMILGVAGALLAAYLLLRRKPKGPDEMQPDGRKPATFLIFQYDVAGVSYEASQDVTYLRQLINLHSCRLGLPTSVRYDPQNPGNSIVVSERWMGLRQ